MSQIFEILDFVTEIELYSEKCGKKEMQKLNDDYAKDIKKGSKKTKANFWKYVAEDKEESDNEETKAKKKKAGSASKVTDMADSTVS
jgi:hypothetical protein